MANQQLDLPPWLSYVSYTNEDGAVETGIAQLPLTYEGPSIPLEWPWTSPGGNGGMRVSLLGGTGFQTLPPMTITAVISTQGPLTETQPATATNADTPLATQTRADQNTAPTGTTATVPFVTTNDQGQLTTIPGAVSTRPDGEQTTVPVAASSAPSVATIYQTTTDDNGQLTTTGTIPGLVSTRTGGGLTTVPATASTLPNGDTTVVPLSPTGSLRPLTTTATLPDSSLTTATGFLSTLSDGETTAVFPSLTTLSESSSDSLSSDSSEAASSDDNSSASRSASSSESSGTLAAAGASNPGLSAGQIAAIVIGAILFSLIIFALLVLCCIRRKRRHRDAAYYSSPGAGTYTRFGNVDPSGRQHQRASDSVDDSEADIDVDPRQLFMQPPAGYTGVGALPPPNEMREVEPAASSRSSGSPRLLGLVPSRQFLNRSAAAPAAAAGAKVVRSSTQASYQTASSSDLDTLVSSSLHGSPPRAPANSPMPPSPERFYDASLGYDTTYTSSNITNPFAPYTDSQPSHEGPSSVTTPPSLGGVAHIGSREGLGVGKPLPTIPASPQASLRGSPTETTRRDEPRPSGSRKISLTAGMSGLGLGAFFGLGRRAISLNGTDDLTTVDREPKDSSTSDPTPVRSRAPLFPGEASPRQRHPSSSSSTDEDGDEEGDESAGLLQAFPVHDGGGDPLLTRWSRTTFGKKIATSSHSGSDNQSMAASILSRRSNQASMSSSLKRAASDGRRVVSEGGSLGRRAENSSSGTQSSSGSSNNKSRQQKRAEPPEVPVRRQVSNTGSSVLETAEEEEGGPTIRLISRSRQDVDKLD